MIRGAVRSCARTFALELRTKESVPQMVLFTLTVYVLFHFGLDRDSLDGELAAGVLWVTLLLAAVIGVSRLFAAEREQGGIEGLLLAPVDRTALFLAKGDGAPRLSGGPRGRRGAGLRPAAAAGARPRRGTAGAAGDPRARRPRPGRRRRARGRPRERDPRPRPDHAAAAAPAARARC